MFDLFDVAIVGCACLLYVAGTFWLLGQRRRRPGVSKAFQHRRIFLGAVTITVGTLFAVMGDDLNDWLYRSGAADQPPTNTAAHDFGRASSERKLANSDVGRAKTSGAREQGPTGAEKTGGERAAGAEADAGARAQPLDNSPAEARHNGPASVEARQADADSKVRGSPEALGQEPNASVVAVPSEDVVSKIEVPIDGGAADAAARLNDLETIARLNDLDTLDQTATLPSQKDGSRAANDRSESEFAEMHSRPQDNSPTESAHRGSVADAVDGAAADAAARSVDVVAAQDQPAHDQPGERQLSAENREPARTANNQNAERRENNKLANAELPVDGGAADATARTVAALDQRPTDERADRKSTPGNREEPARTTDHQDAEKEEGNKQASADLPVDKGAADAAKRLNNAATVEKPPEKSSEYAQPDDGVKVKSALQYSAPMGLPDGWALVEAPTGDANVPQESENLRRRTAVRFGCQRARSPSSPSRQTAGFESACRRCGKRSCRYAAASWCCRAGKRGFGRSFSLAGANDRPKKGCADCSARRGPCRCDLEACAARGARGRVPDRSPRGRTHHHLYRPM